MRIIPFLGSSPLPPITLDFRGVARDFSEGVTTKKNLMREKKSLGFARKFQMFSQVWPKLPDFLPSSPKMLKVLPPKKQSVMAIITLMTPP